MVNIHPLANVESAKIGENTSIWQFSVVLSGAIIGRNCNINCHTFIENDVIIGNNVTIKSGVYLWDGLRVEDDVFIGPNATFTNDKFPRSKKYPSLFQGVILKRGCSVGGNTTFLPGIEIGQFSIIGAGSVVTKDVPNNAIVKGNPAQICGWIDESGNKMIEINKGEFCSLDGKIYVLENNKLVEK